MGQISVSVGGHRYALACRDGEEERLQKLADYIDRKARDVSGALGQVTEARLLLMAAILICDELFDARSGTADRPGAVPESAAGTDFSNAEVDRIVSRLARLVEEVRADGP